MKTTSQAAFLTGRAVTDFICGFVLNRISIAEDTFPEDYKISVTMCFLFAFGAAFLWGFACDLLKSNGRLPATLGCLVSALSLIVYSFYPIFGAVLAGFGAGLMHIGGEIDAVTGISGVSRLGIFISVGAIGYALGLHMGAKELLPVQYPFVLAVFAAACIWALCKGEREASDVNEGKNFFELLHIKSVVVPVVVLFVCSVIGSVIVFGASHPESESKFAWLIPAAAVSVGLFCGGIVSDLINSKVMSVACAATAGIMFYLGTEKYLFYLIGLVLLSATAPTVIAKTAYLFKDREGMAVGFSSLGLFCGYALSQKKLAESGLGKTGVLILALIMAVGFFFAVSGKRILILPGLKFDFFKKKKEDKSGN